jgi:hypothetical protein
VFTPAYSRTVVGGGGQARTMSVATGDLDGDGDQDVVIGGGTTLELYRNLGGGQWTPVLLAAIPTGTQIRDVALADFERRRARRSSGGGTLVLRSHTTPSGDRAGVAVSFAHRTGRSTAYPELTAC